ncbi:MAG TPA: hypothetical protein VG898_05310, partial [Solirubrobacterales bacterium]|nr:hypothetical protein [Solirubrobacterales bacterium]
MKRLTVILTITATALLCAATTAPAATNLQLEQFGVAFSNEDGSQADEAGPHPFAMRTSFRLAHSGSGPLSAPSARLRNVILAQISGVVGDTIAFPRCSSADFFSVTSGENQCPRETAVGITGNAIIEAGNWFSSPVYNLVPPPGVLVRLGFRVVNQNIIVDITLNPVPPYNPIASVRNLPQQEYIFANITELWGNPTDPAHDRFRGNCAYATTQLDPGDPFEFSPSSSACPVGPRGAFLTTPTRCLGANLTSYAFDSFEDPGAFLADGRPELSDPNWVSGAYESPPFTGCGKLGFSPSIIAKPTTRAATSPTGLDFSLDTADEGLKNPSGLAQSDIRKAVVTLPEGMSANPALAEGLEVCSEADLERETLGSVPGEGCPEAAKIGSLEVESPLIAEPVKGSLYQATPYDNLAGDALLAFYIVIKDPELGIIVKQPARVESDPLTGQLTATTDEIPQLPFSHFRLHFREGARSPLTSPSSCGAHAVSAVLYPWSGTEPVTSTSTFQIISGPDNSPCPTGGLPPFHPDL